MSIPIHQKLDKYVKNKYGITPEILPFSHENYEIYRHTDTGKWFAVFIEKERSAFGLDGDGRTEIVCFKLFAVCLMKAMKPQSLNRKIRKHHCQRRNERG